MSNPIASRNFRPLKKSSQYRRKVEATLGGTLQAVPTLQPPKQVGWCYWNVQQHVEASEGGSLVFGWLVSIWPKRIIECLHHAVFMDESGQMLDVTMYPYGNYEHVSFVASDEHSPSLEWPSYVPSKFLKLSRHEAVDNFIGVIRKPNQLTRQIANRARQLGGRFEPYKPIAFAQPIADQEFIQMNNEYTASTHEYDRAIERLAEN